MQKILQTSTESNKNNQSRVAALSYWVSPDRVRQQHPAGLTPTPNTSYLQLLKSKAEPRDGEGMFGARGAMQGQAARKEFRSNSPMK